MKRLGLILLGMFLGLFTGASLLTPARAGLTKISGGMIQDGAIQSQHLAAGLATNPAGTVAAYAGSAAPSGWYLCYGQEYDEVAYPALYTAIGTTYGGTASAPLLPDLRGRVAAGKDDMGGSAANRLTATGLGVAGTTLGNAGGAQTHTLAVSEMPSHNHGGNHTTSTDGAHVHTMNANNGSGETNNNYVYWNQSASGFQRQTDSGGSHSHTLTVASQGGGGAHKNVQPSLILNYIIKQ